MSKRRILTSTEEAAACHTLGCLLAGWPDACEVANTYTKKEPFRNRETPGEVTYVINEQSCESDDFAAKDVLRGYRDKEGKAFTDLNAAIDAIPDAEQRVAVRQALAPALGASMVAFLRNLETIGQLWKKAVPHRRIVRKKTGHLKVGDSKLEMIVVPLEGENKGAFGV